MGQFVCSMLLARRIYQKAPNHKLGSLVDYLDIPSDGVYHRALYDSEMTAKLWLAMLNQIEERYEISSIPYSLVQQVATTPKKSVHGFLKNW